MEIEIEPGKYVVAVSGGVDSMVLLDLLSKKKSIELVVAHFDHGIRQESAKDAELVKKTAKILDLPFEIGYGQLSPPANEDKAREARYQFLEKICQKYGAKAIVTAHHQDDLAETAILNLLRGSGWRGLVAISSNPKVIRPMLGFTKEDIKTYARQNKLEWREDKTNLSRKFTRNRIRQDLMPKLSPEDRNKLIALVGGIQSKQIKKVLEDLSVNIKVDEKIDRKTFAMLPSAMAGEIMREWLAALTVKNVDKRMVDRLVVAMRTAKANSRHNVAKNLWLKVEKDKAEFAHD